MRGQFIFCSAFLPGLPINAITTVFNQAGFTTGFIVTFLGFELAGNENHSVGGDSMVVSSFMSDNRGQHFNAAVVVIG